MPAPSEPGPSSIELTDPIIATINGATTHRTPIAVAYVDPLGQPHLSPRGTVQVYGPDQLALWARSRGLPDALAVNPRVALLYQNLADHTIYQFTGRGRPVDDASFRDWVFDHSPPHEQAQDPERTGTAVLVELDTLRGRSDDGFVMMARMATVAGAPQPGRARDALG
jgi:hypothetical protein